MSQTTINEIKTILIAEFSPSEIEVIDESHLHLGHAGAESGKGHYALRIVSDKFSSVMPINRHKMIYAVLAELMQTKIHALSIKAKS